jgi:hypothetical protein
MAEKKSFWNNIFGGNDKKTFQDTSNYTDNKSSFKYQQFGTPLVKIGKGDITKPYIDSSYVNKDTYVRFGYDNLFPSIIDQMYYQSPLHSTIIDFQINATIGGGWEIIGEKEGKEKVEEYTFVKKLKLNKLVKSIAYDIKMQNENSSVVYRKLDW